LRDFPLNRQKLKAALAVAALFFIVLSLAGPQFGTRLVEMQQRGVDVVIAVDVYNSMLAEDAKPNRLAKAKELLSGLIQQLGGNRVGIVAFAGTAFWQCPLTLDISAANLFLQVMDVNLIPLPGTALGDAIRLSAKGLPEGASKSKAIVLLTDGEDHNTDPAGAAADAARSGIKIFTIGFGNPAGEPIPVRDAQGAFTGYRKNKKGEVVMSKMDEALLSKIALETGGLYLRAQDGYANTAPIIDAIQGLDKNKLTSRLNRQFEERYQYLLIFGLLLLLAELLIPESRKNTDLEN
jgi:Ca-activated chloride channel family protein